MNQTIEHQLQHRTIRAWKPQEVSPQVRSVLEHVAQRTASSTGMQAAGIIRITDKKIREGLARIGGQDYLAQAPELWMFIADSARNAAIAKEKGADAPQAVSMDAFFTGFTDAVLMAQNVVNAAESLGLGTNFYGCIHNDTAAVVDLLKLPELTYPVLGLGFGYPDQSPALKPRMPMNLRISENTYHRPASWVEVLKEYDEELNTYYDLRDNAHSVGAFTDQVVRRAASVVARRADLLKVARSQGFDLNLEEA